MNRLLPKAVDLLSSRSLVRYVMAGGLSNVVSYALFVGLYTVLFRHHVVPAYVAAAVLAMPLSFALNRTYVFGSRADLVPELRRFLLVYALAIVAGLGILLALIRIVPAPVVVTQAIATVILVVCVFLAHALWTFAHRGRRGDSPRG